MTTFDLVVASRRAITPDGERPAAVGIAEGVIQTVAPYDRRPDARTVVDLGDRVLLPGLVDTHVHVNEPGRTEWEGFATATRAAAAGGVTTIVDMPLNSIPATVSVAALEEKRGVAGPKCFVDVGFWGGAVPGNVTDLRPLHDAGVFGFKCFLLDSGVDEFPPLDAAGLELALRELSSFDGLMIVHAEDAPTIDAAPECHGTRYREFLASRPKGAENLAIARLVEFSRRLGVRVHVLHLSSAEALPQLARARQEGLRVTVETCPHYLSLGADEVPDGATEYKCCPPIRDADNREALWDGLAAGTIDCIVSDHSPCTPELKRRDTGDFGDAWGGIASLQLGLPVIWTEASRRGHGLGDVVRWMAAAPAALAGLDQKGAIAVGKDADLVAFEPEERFVVDAGALEHRNPVTPYHRRPLTGVVRSTWLRGEPVGDQPRGRLLHQDADAGQG